jgi:hypothetical protein
MAHVRCAKAWRAAAAALIACIASAVWWLTPPAAEPIRLADEAAILDHTPSALTVFRFSSNPRVLILDFPSLAEQGRMFNRIAALTEKAGLPRDRVLDDSALDAAIRDSGATPATYYDGHDYSAADVMRFFAFAQRDGIALTAEEHRLRTLALREGWTGPGVSGAVISIPRAGAAAALDRTARSVILHHELSHGEYFTVPEYAAHTRRFWQQTLTEQERGRFRRFLAASGYDTGNEDLVTNEMQAYLVHTRDPSTFNAAMVGMSEAQFKALRAAFIAAMPQSWLRDATRAAFQSAPLVNAAERRAAPRRRSPGGVPSAARGRWPQPQRRSAAPRRSHPPAREDRRRSAR